MLESGGPAFFSFDAFASLPAMGRATAGRSVSRTHLFTGAQKGATGGGQKGSTNSQWKSKKRKLRKWVLSEVTSQRGSTCLRSGRSQDTYLGIVGMRRILEVPPGGGRREGNDGRGGERKEGSGRNDDDEGWRITLCEI